jgi:hypothetical protein
VVLGHMKALALRHGCCGLLAPIRPILKPQYPLLDMDAYIAWRCARARKGLLGTPPVICWHARRVVLRARAASQLWAASWRRRRWP